MKFLRSKLAAFLMDICCCILLGAAASTILLPYTGLEVGFGDCLLLVTADVVLIALFTRKWWLFPVTLISIATFALLLTTIFDINKELWSYIEGFISWCSSSYPDSLPYSVNGSIIIVQLVMVLPVAAVSYIFYRRFFLFAVLPPIAAALMVWAYLTDRDVFWPVFVMLIFVIFLSMAKMTSNRINRNLLDSEKISSAQLMITALVIVPVIILFAFGISPKEDGDWKAKWLVNIVEDFQGYIGWGDGTGPMQGSFNIGISGFSPLGQRLGGNVTLDNTEIIKVTTETPFYLTGAIYDTYDGKRWYDSCQMHRYRYKSLLWQSKRSEIFGFDKPNGNNRAKELFSEISVPAEFKISFLDSGRTLFYAGNVGSLESNYFDVSDVFFNDQSELFISEPKRSFSYTLKTVYFNRSASSFNSKMNELESIMQNFDDKYMNSIQSEYLQLPDSLPQNVYKTAENITAGCETDFEKALAIESWLAKNCTYTLSPGKPPDDSDFVDNFLQDKKGYCVYFASAMTVLARASGLSTRFVTGYALKRNPSTSSTDSYIATNATAHAWTEIYFKGIGWITFDPTNWNFYEDGIVDHKDSEGYYPMPAPTQISEAGDINSPISQSEMPVEVKIILIALAVLALALIFYVVMRLLLFLTGSNGYYRRLCKKYKTLNDRINECYRNIVHQTVFLNIKQEPGDTITSYAKRVDKYLDSCEMTLLCDFIIRMRFGMEELCDSDLKKLCVFSAELEKRLRKDLGVSGYLFRRILLGR